MFAEGQYDVPRLLDLVLNAPTMRLPCLPSKKQIKYTLLKVARNERIYFERYIFMRS